MSKPVYSPEERVVVEQFKATHHRAADGMFVVPLPRKQDAMPLGESRSQAVRRFLSLERALHSKGQFKEVYMMSYKNILTWDMLSLCLFPPWTNQ